MIPNPSRLFMTRAIASLVTFVCITAITYFIEVLTTCVLDRVLMLVGLVKLISNFALKDGSSKQGNALLASVGENWVLASNLKIRSY